MINLPTIDMTGTGQNIGLSSRRYWVQVPWGLLWRLRLKVRMPASQAGNDGFKPHRSYCQTFKVYMFQIHFCMLVNI